MVAPRADFETLIDAKALAALVEFGDAVLVLDARADLAEPARARAAYATGHLPGAMFADLETDLAGAYRPGHTGRHPLPDPDALAARLRSWGARRGQQIVVYDADSGAFAARAWWLIRWLGHRAVALLDGGLAAWRDAGGTLSDRAATPVSGDFERGAPLVDLVTAADLLRSTAAFQPIDARAAPRFRGEVEPIDPVAGHIPGAISLPFEDNLDADQHFLPPESLRRRFVAVAAAEAKPVMYCGSGVTACHNVLAMCHAGLPAPALYAGSWSEWITEPTRPVATGE